MTTCQRCGTAITVDDKRNYPPEVILDDGVADRPTVNFVVCHTCLAEMLTFIEGGAD